MKKYLIIIAFLISLAVSANAYEPIIQEGKVWEYLSSSYFQTDLERYSFKGTELIDGKTYHKWVLIESSQMDNQTGEIHEYENNEVAGLMREDGEGKVFLLLGKGEIVRHFADDPEKLSEPLSLNEPEEVLLYDFNQSAGSSFPANVSLFVEFGETPIRNILSTCKVVEESEESNNGVTWSRQTLIPGVYPFVINNLDPDLQPVETPGNDIPESSQIQIYCVRGIGNVGNGTMTSISPIEPLFLTSSSIMNNQFVRLNNVYDNNSNIIYSRVGYTFPSTPGAVEEVGVDTKDSPIFDLFGREITRPLPGSVYIQNGKKFIGK